MIYTLIAQKDLNFIESLSVKTVEKKQIVTFLMKQEQDVFDREKNETLFKLFIGMISQNKTMISLNVETKEIKYKKVEIEYIISENFHEDLLTYF